LTAPPKSFKPAVQRAFREMQEMREIFRRPIDNRARCVHDEFLIDNILEPWRSVMRNLIQRIWSEDQGQDIAEYAVMLAVILVLVVGTIRLVGSNANTVFSNVGSAVQ
jgi:pilus assembly protein Flp/PilA